jgi:hypothetical protein
VAGAAWAAGGDPPAETATRARAAARPVVRCDAVWVGGRRGDWGRARNWSTGRVPAESTHACLPRGTTADVSHGRNLAWAVEGGSLNLRGGSLLLMGTVVASEVADLRLVASTLGGPGKLVVTRHFFWGRAGGMRGQGAVDLGVASRSLIATGEGGGAGDIGLPDGTPLHAVTGRDATPPACGAYSPPWAEACATRDRRAADEVRRAWRRFATVVDDAARSGTDRVDAIAALLAPGTCALESESHPPHVPARRGDCRHVARGILAEVTGHGPLSPAAGTTYVEGDQAVTDTDDPESVRLRRVDGAWRVAVV